MASFQFVGALCVDPRVAEEAIDRGLADLPIYRVDGVRKGNDAADHAVSRGSDVSGEVGS